MVSTATAAGESAAEMGLAAELMACREQRVVPPQQLPQPQQPLPCEAAAAPVEPWVPGVALYTGLIRLVLRPLQQPVPWSVRSCSCSKPFRRLCWKAVGHSCRLFSRQCWRCSGTHVGLSRRPGRPLELAAVLTQGVAASAVHRVLVPGGRPLGHREPRPAAGTLLLPLRSLHRRQSAGHKAQGTSYCSYTHLRR